MVIQLHLDAGTVSVPAGHTLQLGKFAALRRLLDRQGLLGDAPIPTSLATRELLCSVHESRYVDAALEGTLSKDSVRRLGVPWSSQWVRYARASVMATVQAAELSLLHGRAIFAGGGMHHAFAAYGAAFCWFNDLAIAARHLLATRRSSRILILDCDAHQGDGTAHIFAAEPAVFTCSLHGAHDYPYRKQRSDLDVELATGTTDNAYLEQLAQALETIERRLFRPSLVLYNAGVDVHRQDALGRLALSDAGVYQRDRFVLAWCTARNVPVAAVLGGSYGADPERLAERHALLFYAAHGLSQGPTIGKEIANDRQENRIESSHA